MTGASVLAARGTYDVRVRRGRPDDWAPRPADALARSCDA